MNQNIEHAHDRGERGRHGNGQLHNWLPLVLSIATTLVALGVMYGALGGRLQLIEYRLMKIEQRIGDGR